MFHRHKNQVIARLSRLPQIMCLADYRQFTPSMYSNQVIARLSSHRYCLAVSRRSRALPAPSMVSGVFPRFPVVMMLKHICVLYLTASNTEGSLSPQTLLSKSKLQTDLQTQTLTNSKTNRNPGKSSRPPIQCSSVFPLGVRFPANALKVRLVSLSLPEIT